MSTVSAEARTAQLLGWASFSRRLRLLSALGIASAVAGLLADALGSHLGWPQPAALSGGQTLFVPLAWIPLATLLVCVGWSYLLAGALHSPRWLRVLTAVGWAVLTWPILQVTPGLAWPGYLLVPLLLLWRRWARPLADFGLWEYLTFFGAGLLLCMTAAVASLWQEIPLLAYTAGLSTQFILMTGVAMPLLILAGTDLAELAGKAGGWLTDRMQGWGTPGLAWLLLALSLAKGVYFLLDGWRAEPGLWLTLGWMAGLAVLGRWLPRGQWLAEPPFPLLITLLGLALLVPVGGMLAIALLPAGWAPVLGGTGFVGSILLAALTTVLLRPWLNRRWPGAWVALLITAVWLAWLVAGGSHMAWAPASRGTELAVAAGCIGLALAALCRGDSRRRLLLVGLEVTLTLTAVRGIQAAYDANWDLGDVYTTLQALVVVGAAGWLWLRHHRPGVRAAVLAGVVLVVAGLGLALGSDLVDWLQDRTQLLLVCIALVWEIALADRRLGPLLGERVPPANRTFIYIGFSLLLVVVVGWFRALQPPPPQLTDLDPLPAFGLIAIGLPLYLLAAARRLYQE